MYCELSHIGFSIYYLDLTTQIGIEVSRGKKRGPPLFVYTHG